VVKQRLLIPYQVKHVKWVFTTPCTRLLTRLSQWGYFVTLFLC